MQCYDVMMSLCYADAMHLTKRKVIRISEPHKKNLQGNQRVGSKHRQVTLVSLSLKACMKDDLRVIRTSESYKKNLQENQRVSSKHKQVTQVPLALKACVKFVGKYPPY